MSNPYRPSQWRRAFTSANTSERDINIGVQAENIFGDVSYVVSGDDTPLRKYTVAKNYIAGGRLRSAEELIREAVAGGLVSSENPSSFTNEVAYYWTLSVLGDRAFELIDKEPFEQIAQAREIARRGPQDQWSQAHRVLTELIDCLQAQEESGILAPVRLDAFFSAFERLGPVQQEEIRRHLDLILSGAFQDRLTAHDAETVRTKRMGNSREERVWKFFEPVPAKPRPVPVVWPALDLLHWTMAIWGALMTAAGLFLAAVLVTWVNWKTAAVSGILVTGCGALVCYAGPGLLPARYAPSPTRDRKAPRKRRWDPEQRRFSDHVHRTVQRQYEKRAPGAALQQPLWTAATRRARTRLAHEVTEIYSPTGIAPSRIDWLIAWHAEEARREWRPGKARDLKRILRVAVLAAGALGMTTGGRMALSKMEMAEPLIADIALIWLIVGSVLLIAGRADVHLVARYTHRAWQARFAERFRQEMSAYEARQALLENRPDDAEMARWLDYDKFYLKSLAMNQYGLGNRDVVAHAFLIEAAPKCRRARLKNGPPRFSAYSIWVFLLTDSGVRQMVVHLDFPTGIVKDQQRTAFRYDALASAQISEFGIRFDDGRRESFISWSGSRRNAAETDKSALVFFQIFRLSLVSGQHIDITVENLEEWLFQRTEGGQGATHDGIPDTSDLTGAFGILEAIAADGSSWVSRARERRRRRLPVTQDGARLPVPPPNEPGGNRASGPLPGPYTSQQTPLDQDIRPDDGRNTDQSAR